MDRRGQACLTFALVLLAVLAPSAPAQASSSSSSSSSFKKLGAISDPPASLQEVAMDPSGRAFFVWDRDDPANPCGTPPCRVIETRVRTAGGTLGPVETLSDPTRDSFDPEVAVDERGNAVFTWAADDAAGFPDVMARTRNVSGALGPIETISSPAASSVARPHVAVDENGDAVFVWEELDLVGPCGPFGCIRARARARSAAGVLGPQHDLSAPNTNGVLPQLGIDEDGNAVFVWQLDDGTPSCGSCSIVQTRALSATGVLGPTKNVSDPGFTGQGQVAVNEDGKAVFTWERFDGTTQCGSGECSRIQTRTRSSSGTLSKIQTISDPGQDAIAPQVGIAGNGNAVFVWSRGDGSSDCNGDTACFRAQVRARTWGGTLSKVQTISEEKRNALVPQVGVDSRGNAVFAWERVDENFICSFVACAQVQVRSRSYEGTLSKTQTVSDLGLDANPMVAVDPNGGRAGKTADAATDWVGPLKSIEAAVQKGDDR